MALLRYAGPGPQDDGRGGLVRPGDVWEWPDPPGWGPWEPVEDSGGSESDQEAPGTAGGTQPPTGGAENAVTGQGVAGADVSTGTAKEI